MSKAQKSNGGASPDAVRNPHNLPTKVCPACNRAFTWRKKWERDWENVVYCSDACKKTGKRANHGD